MEDDYNLGEPMDEAGFVPDAVGGGAPVPVQGIQMNPSDFIPDAPTSQSAPQRPQAPVAPRGTAFVDNGLQEAVEGFVDDTAANVRPESQVGVMSAEVRPDADREETLARASKLTLPYRSAVSQLGIAAANNPNMTDEQINLVLDSLDARHPEVMTAMKAAGADPRAWAFDVVKGTQAGKYSQNVPGFEVPGLSDENYAADPGLLTALKSAALSTPAGAGSLAGAKLANTFTPGAPAPVKLGATLLGTVGGAAAAQYGAENLYDLAPELMEQLGVSRGQRMANAAENPLWDFAGQMVGSGLGFKPSLRGGVMNHSVNAGVGGVTEAVMQATAGEDFDLGKIAISAAGNALMSDPNRMGRWAGFEALPKVTADYNPRPFSEHVTFDVDKSRLEAMSSIQTKSVDDIISQPNIVDSPENRARLERSKAAFEAGDTVTSRRELTNLEIKRNNGLDQDTAVEYVNEVLAGMENAPDTVVHSAFDDGTVPAHLKAKAGTLGVFDKDTGKVHVFADQLTNKEDAVAVAFHEILGHASMAWKYTDELNTLLVNMYEKGNKNFKNAVDSWILNNPDAYDDLTGDAKLAAQVDEVLADKSSNGVIKTTQLDLVKNFIKKTARAAGMDHLEFSDREILAILATGHDNIIRGGDRATGLGGVRYIMAGTASEKADYNQAHAAQKMVAQGADPERVRQMTGWHKGDDGQWRYEIDDSKFDFNVADTGDTSFEVMKAFPDESVQADEFFNHPELFESYPELRDIKVSVKPDFLDFGRTAQGWYNSSTKELVLTPYSVDPKGTAIHELQHAVQDIEGFSPGGNTETSLSHVNDEVILQNMPDMEKYIKQLEQKFDDKLTALQAAENDPAFQEWIAAEKLSDEMFQKTKDLDPLDPAKKEWLDQHNKAGKLRAALRTSLGLDKFDFNSEDAAQFREIGRYLKADPEQRNEILTESLKAKQELISTRGLMNDAVRSSDADLGREALSRVEGTSYAAYKAIHGEAEARDATNRLGLDAEGRRMTKPMQEESTGVAPSEYVFPKSGPRPYSMEIAQNRRDPEAAALRQAVQEEAEFYGMRPEQIKRALQQPDFRAEVRMNLAKKGLDQDIYDKHVAALVEDPPVPTGDVRFARRPTRNVGLDKRTEDYLDTHLGPDKTNRLHGLVANLPEHRRVPDEELISNALELGVDLETVRKMGPMADNSDYVVAYADLLNDSANKLLRSAETLNSKGGYENEAELLRNLAEFGEISNAFDTTRSNLGRMMRALQVKVGTLGEDFRGLADGFELGDGSTLTSENILRMAQRIAEGGQKQLKKEVDRFDPDWKKYAMSLYYNGLLGSWETQLNNLKGNTSNILRYLVTDTLGSAAGAARGLADDGERLTFAESGARWKGVGKALINPELYRSVVRELTAPANSPHNQSIWQSQAITNQPASMVIESATRMLQAGDAFFRGIVESSNMYGLAVRHAQREAQDQLGGRYGSSAHADYIAQRVPQLMDAPTKEMLKEVQQAGVHMLFQDKLGPNSKRMAAMRDIEIKGFPVGRFILPILTVPANIIKASGELTGVPSAKRLLKKEVTGADKDREIAKLAVAGTVTAAAWMMAAEGEITGLGPSDPKQRAEWLLHHKPQSIKIGDDWVPYKSLDPFATYLTITADTIQAAQRGSKKIGDNKAKGYLDLAFSMVDAAGKALLSNHFLDNLVNLTENSDSLFQNLLLNMAGPFSRMPIVGATAVTSDPYQRDMSAPDIAGRISNRAQSLDSGIWTQGGREALPIRVDPLGRLMKRDNEPELDATVNELGRLFNETGINIVGGSGNMRGTTQVPAEIMNTHRLIVGPAVKKELEKIMARPDYAGWSDKRKARQLQTVATKVRTAYGALLDAQLLERDPEYKYEMVNELKQSVIEEQVE